MDENQVMPDAGRAKCNTNISTYSYQFTLDISLQGKDQEKHSMAEDISMNSVQSHEDPKSSKEHAHAL